jgi:hypothetical protein
VRKHDPDRGLVVLRADKLLGTSDLDHEDRAVFAERIHELLRGFGTEHVVIEGHPQAGPLHLLDEMTKSRWFALVKRLPLRSSDARLADTSLAIYKYLGYTPPRPGQVLRVNLPLVGRSISVPLDDVLRMVIR